ncbi:MAG: hypothetical protein HYT03_02700 [Candidatus Harrisonbacteria bacterium]|nr:hypothetical protein [Candidatus Harrisonbacteria bacterium]
MKPIRTSKGLKDIIWEKILEEFSKAKSTRELGGLFNALLTDQERESVARRLAALSLVKKGHSYKSIGEKLWISPVTISTVKKTILANQEYKSRYALNRDRKTKILHSEVKNQKSESIFSEWLDHLAFILENPPQISGPRWNFLKYNPTLPKKYRRGGTGKGRN